MSTASTVVELILTYYNPSPQVKALLNSLHNLSSTPAAVPAPTTVTRPWALSRRLSSEDLEALVAAYQAGHRQRDLATKFGISLSSVQRLLGTRRTAHE